jgi:hypothetical protein
MTKIEKCIYEFMLDQNLPDDVAKEIADKLSYELDSLIKAECLSPENIIEEMNIPLLKKLMTLDHTVLIKITEKYVK